MRRLRGPWGPPLTLGGIGVFLLALGLWNLNRELTNLRIEWGPVLAFGQIAIPALVVVYAGYRLSASSFNREERWRVTLFGVAGLLLVGGGVYSTILVRLAEARAVGEPQYVLGVMSGLGTAGGAVLGSFSVTSRRDARQAQRARDNFELLNSIIRHDILNSMMIVQSRAEFIEEEADEERIREFAGTILTQTNGVVDQVERTRAILQALRTSDPRLEAVDLAAVVEGELETIRTTYDTVAVETDLPGALYVRADDLLDDVVGNVLSNAVEHNDKDEPRLSVSATVLEDGQLADRTGDEEEHEAVVELRIADNGPGVDDDLKDAVFRRDETGLHEDGTGSGFGLFFVDTMMGKYGGDVSIEDNDPEGAVFVFRFGAAEPADEGTADASDVVEVPA
ncbi:ATP-binding protein [Haloglomus litoreum]|uniref:ATP-binding protein n=1 Tax=Haloglomus litoreum TaxID=3034026 RepID=UPI0023E85660|nr:ATP-binding protein [Haloglomus sp. DT116]